ncbi:MAG: CRISPR-associated endonuclease Cas1 [Sandaracinaceae bacterium]|nr:CRISPR-associated endonuclease Cas1 [Sandaracinaceae bacterium]
MSAPRTVYVTANGAVVRRSGERLHVFAKKDRIADLPIADVSDLVLMGNVTLTPSALGTLVDRGIDTVLLTHAGRYRGRIVGGASSNVRLRLRQYELHRDADATLALAKRLVAGKAHNQRAMLMRHARRHGLGDELRDAVRALRAAALRVELATTLDEARGCEGAAAAAYFRVFGRLLRNPDFTFTGRNRRPPIDPVNALLSLGYTLLFGVVEGAIRTVGLDPWLGSLHAPLAGRPSLACDLVEELRAPIVDALVVSAINHRAFAQDDFEDAGPGEPVILRRETVRWLVTLFERRMVRRTAYEPFGVELTWRQILEHQARAYARHVLGEGPYEPYRMR